MPDGLMIPTEVCAAAPILSGSIDLRLEVFFYLSDQMFEGRRAEVRVARPEKVALVAEVRDQLEKAKAVILTDFQGLNVQEIGDLRKRLRELDTDYRVVKNTMITRAAKEADIPGLDEFLEGPTALVFTYADPAATAKAIVDFGQEFPALEVKAAWMDGSVVLPDHVKKLASLPSREQLLAMLVGGLNAPLTRLVTAVRDPIQKLAYLLSSVAESGGDETSGD